MNMPWTAAALLAAILHAVLLISPWSAGAALAADAAVDAARGVSPQSHVAIEPVDPRCEHLSEPLGIDARQPRLSWTLRSDRRGQRQTAYRVTVATRPEMLAQDTPDLWDSGRIESSRTLGVAYEGKPLQSGQAAYWQVMVWDRDGNGPSRSAPSRWEMGLLTPDDWQARWIAGPTEPWPDDPADAPSPARSADGKPQTAEPVHPPHPYLRRSFTLDKSVARARLYITSLGYHEIHLNGRKVGDRCLDPAQSDFSRRVLYATHDVTPCLTEGDNVLAVALGKGWYWKGVRGVTLDVPALLAQLVIEHPDGTQTLVATDRSWRYAPAPVAPIGRFPRGEWIDARRELPAWTKAGHDDSAWKPAVEVDVPPLKRSAQAVRPSRVLREIEVSNVRQLGPHSYLFDLGTNLTGWFRWRLRAERDREIVLTYYAAHTNASDRLTENFRQVDRYIANGSEAETFCSRFNYRAFRYVKVDGVSWQPKPDDARGLLIATASPASGSFRCSDPNLNRLVQAVAHTHRCLTMGAIQVDCPHRERLGYGAEGQAGLRQALWNFDTRAFYPKWVRDFADGQHPETGEVNYTAPYRIGSGGGPAWGGAIIAFPWQAYVFHGDRQILARHYDRMKRWLAFLESKSEGGILQYYSQRPENYWEFLGDWAPPKRPGDTGPGPNPDVWPCHWYTRDENTLFNSMHRCLQTRLLARVAEALDKTDEAANYRRQADAISEAVNRKYFDPQKNRYRVGNHQQAFLALALVAEVAPQDRRQKVLGTLLHDIEVRLNGHLDTGVLGSTYLLDALQQAGRQDVIHQIVMQPEPPSWKAMLDQGATTIWEHWRPAWSSIHNSFLSVGAWPYESIAGIRPDPDAPGFAHFFVEPHAVGGLTWAEAKLDTVRGPIHSHWSTSTDGFWLRVVVPCNSSATIILPAAASDDLTESGRTLSKAEAVRLLRRETDRAVIRVESGTYEFAVR